MVPVPSVGAAIAVSERARQEGEAVGFRLEKRSAGLVLCEGACRAAGRLGKAAGGLRKRSVGLFVV